jgi:hypothetical protein
VDDLAGPLRVLGQVRDVQRLAVDVVGDQRPAGHSGRQLLGEQQGAVQPTLHARPGGEAGVAGQECHDGGQRHHDGRAEEYRGDQHRV